MDTDRDTAVPVWEASKENVLPIKRGRSAKGLSASLAHPVSKETLNADQERAFEHQLSDKSVVDPLQRLELYVRYLKWVRDTYPSVTDKALQILEKCTFELKDYETLKNDVRFISLWVEYADMVRTPGEIFTFMQNNKIGERVALFWIAWAYVAEKALNYKLADQIFQKAVRRGAEPKDLLNSRYKQFQRRMARLYLNSDTGSNSGTDSAHSNATVDAAITAAAMEAIRSAPTVAAAPAASATTAGGVERSALRRLGGEGPNGGSQGVHEENRPSSTARVPTGSSAVTGRSRPSGSTSTSAPRQSSAVPSAPAAPVRPSAPNAGFEIFCDNPAMGGAPAEGGPAPTWKNLGTEAVRRKENDGPVTKWTEGPLVSNYVAPTAPSAPAIAIFVDEQFANPEPHQASPASAMKHSRAAGSPVPHVLGVRKQLDAAEGIAKNPLARHTHALAPTPATATTTAPAAADVAPIASLGALPSRASSTNAAPSGRATQALVPATELPVFTSAAPPPVPSVVAPAIVTKASHKVASTGAPAATAKPAAAGLPFTIFSDEPVAAKPAVKSSGLGVRPAAASAPIAPSTAFSIYESPTAGTAPASARAQAPRPAAPSTGLSFSIYESPTSAAPTAVQSKASKAAAAPPKVSAPAAGAGIPFNIFVDESPVAPASKPATKPSAAEKSTLAFSIFESPAQPAPKVPTSKKVLAPVPPLSFDIYVDESLAAPAATAVPVAAPVVKAPLAAVKPVLTPAPSTPAAHGTADHHAGEAEEHDAELQALLDNMMQADGEDGTINTRLARRDIDMMFCSPTVHRAPPPPTHTQSQAPSARPVPVPVFAGDENSFCLKSAGGLFKASGSGDEHDYDQEPPTARSTAAGGQSSQPRLPLRAADANSSMVLMEEEADYDEFDNDYCGGNTSGAAGAGGDNVAQGAYAGAGRLQGQGSQVGGVLQKATHRPFGVHLDTFSAVKDLSAIKESSQEFSLCGMLETPGHTGTLGFGGAQQRYAHTGGRQERDHRASYSAMGNMLMDLSYTGYNGGGPGNADSSRESFGSVVAAAPAPASSGGFQIFEDSGSGSGNGTTASASAAGATTGKRKGLSEQRPYTGIDGNAAEPLPSRRRLYNPFEMAGTGRSHGGNGNLAAAQQQREKRSISLSQPQPQPQSAVQTNTSQAKLQRRISLTQPSLLLTSSLTDADALNAISQAAASTAVTSPFLLQSPADHALRLQPEAVGVSLAPARESSTQRQSQCTAAALTASSIAGNPLPHPSDKPPSAALPRSSPGTAQPQAHLQRDCKADAIAESLRSPALSCSSSAASSLVLSPDSDSDSDADSDADADAAGGELCATQSERRPPAAVVTTETAAILPAVESATSARTAVHAAPQYRLTAPLEADTFHTLQPATFARILQHVQEYYQHSPAMQVTVQHSTPHPACFTFRGKPNTRDAFELPIAGADSRRWRVVSNIGRGSYGHAILMELVPTSSNTHQQQRGVGERVVFKVDLQRESVLWEAFIHLQIQDRLAALQPASRRALLQEQYARYVLCPSGLQVYEGSAVLRMRYCEWGTLITVLRALMQRGAFSPAEHEYLVAHLAEQMIQAVLVLHSAGILHCDIKTDNWLVGRAPCCSTHSGAKHNLEVPAESEVRVRLIDFGRSLSAWRHRRPAAVSAAVPTQSTVEEESPQQSQEQSYEQYRELCRLYDTCAADNACVSANVEAADSVSACVSVSASESRAAPTELRGVSWEEVRYRGDVSCKAYKCQEMADGLPWSYQVDFHGLGNCIHQLLHLQPLATVRESVALIGSRGLDLQAALRQLNAQDAAGANAAASAVHRYTVPQASLKRYWNKPVWSAVYLVLLNYSAFASLIPAPGDGHERGESAGAGAVKLLQSVLAAVRGLLATESASAVKQTALAKLSACLEQVEI